MTETQKHSLADIVTVKSGKFIRYMVVAALMAVAAVGGVNAEQIKLLDYKTGEMFFIDDSEVDKYKYTYSTSYDELGFSYEFDCRYAEVTECGNGAVAIVPIGTKGERYTFQCSHYWTMKELLYNKGSIYKSVKHTVLEADYVEIAPCKLVALHPYCPGCRYPYKMEPFTGYQPSDIVDYYYYYGYKQAILSASVSCDMLQYNQDEQIVRLYTHQKIRFDYSTDYYEMPEQPAPPTEEPLNAILFDYETGEMTEMDSEQPVVPDEYKCHSTVTYDDSGWTFEYDARYAMLYPQDGSYKVVPCGMENGDVYHDYGLEAAVVYVTAAASEVQNEKEYKGLTYKVIEEEYAELNSFEPASINHCNSCLRPMGVSWYEGFMPSLVNAKPWMNGYSHHYLAGRVMVAAMQYSNEEKTMHLYKRLKIRFDYTKNYGFEEQSGVAEVEADGGDGEAQYFNLQGMRVAEPRAGQLYIERRGNSGRLLRL